VIEDLVEALAAGHLVMERADHTALRPGTLRTPGRAENQIVDGGAERIVSTAQQLARQPCRRGLGLERLPLAHDAVAQPLDVALRHRSAHARSEAEQH